MSGNASLLLIIAKQTDGTDLLGCSSGTNNFSEKYVIYPFSLYTVYTQWYKYSHKTILKKQKCETVLAENVCKPLKAEEEAIFQGRRDVENATNYKKDLFFFFQSSRNPNNSVTDNTDQEKKKKSQNKTKHTFIALTLFMINWGSRAFIKYLPGGQQTVILT